MSTENVRYICKLIITLTTMAMIPVFLFNQNVYIGGWFVVIFVSELFAWW